MSQGSIRELGLDDLDRLLALWQRAGLHSLKPQGRDSRDALTRQLASGVQKVFGMESGEKLVGAVVATHDGRKGWINRLAVDPSYRRRGYATKLIEAAERALYQQGLCVIAALIESDNPVSLALFRKLGYVDAGRDIHYLSKRESGDV